MSNWYKLSIRWADLLQCLPAIVGVEDVRRGVCAYLLTDEASVGVGEEKLESASARNVFHTRPLHHLTDAIGEKCYSAYFCFR